MSGLNWKEQRVVKLLAVGSSLTLVQLGNRCFPGVRPRSKRLSWVRNALRRPREHGLVLRVSKGTYKAVT